MTDAIRKAAEARYATKGFQDAYEAGYAKGLDDAAKLVTKACLACGGTGGIDGPFECCGHWIPAGGREDGEPECCGRPVSEPYPCEDCGRLADDIRTLRGPT